MTEFHVLSGANDVPVYPEIRKIGVPDLISAVKSGFADFLAQPSHLFFLVLIYPLIGAFLAFWTSGANLLPLLFPLMSGFALVGPFAAIGLYEISRRREAGLDSSWRRAFGVFKSPAVPSIIAVGLLLALIFVAWMLTANSIYTTFMGAADPKSLSEMLGDIFRTSQGWSLIIFGNLAGLVFAACTLCCSVIAFPLLLDRDTGAAVAVITSFRAVRENPVTMAIWGLMVAVSVAAGFILLFGGLALVFPVLGHATWHLYRRVIVPAPIKPRK